MNRSDIVAAWKRCQGVPFSHQGRDPLIGLDCIGLALRGYFEAGWEPECPDLISSATYKRLPDSALLTSLVENECVEIPVLATLPGDLLLMTWPGMDELPCHIACITDAHTTLDGKRISIIHTHWIMKEVKEHGLTKEWKDRVTSAWRCKALV